MKAYISCFDPDLSSRGTNLGEWKNQRETLNEKHRSLSIELRDVKIQEGSGETGTVSSVHDYRADDYRDIGVKELLLSKKGKQYKD